MVRNLEIFECEMIQTPEGPKPDVKEMKGHKLQVSAQGVDEARAQVKKLLAERKMQARSISFTTNGAIRVVVMKPQRRQGALPGNVFRRPAPQT